MPTPKEHTSDYPMSTAWYIVDKDGNVGIMNFGENGPVPCGTEEASIEDLVFGYEGNGDFQRISLSDDQIFDLMESPHHPKEEKLWLNVAIRVDKNQIKDFLALTNNPDIECHELSSKLSLYVLDAVDCFSDNEDPSNGKLLETSSLYKMLDKGMILKVRKLKDFYINDVWENDTVVYEHDFTSAPYFIYAEPYWPELLAERMNIPENPVKTNQLPKELSQHVFHIPVSFNECKNLQIAEWIPCSCRANKEKIIDGCKYSLLPLTDGSEAYIFTDKPSALKTKDKLDQWNTHYRNKMSMAKDDCTEEP